MKKAFAILTLIVLIGVVVAPTLAQDPFTQREIAGSFHSAVNSAPNSAATQAASAISVTSKIAFGSTDKQNPYIDLFTIDADGKNAAQLTHNLVRSAQPAWSPDGTMLAYVAQTPNIADSSYDILVIGSNGANQHKVSSQPSKQPGAVVWSPDSKQLVFISQRAATGELGIYKVNTDGSDEHQLKIDGINPKILSAFTLSWSADGKRIAFMAVPTSGNDWALLFADADGANVKPGPVITVVQALSLFQWSPDGQHAVITDRKSLTVTDAQGMTPKVVVDPASNLTITSMTWSPDGKQIAFTSIDYPTSTVTLYVINADGSNMQKVDLGGRDIDTTGIAWGIVPANLPSKTSPGTPALKPSSTPKH